MLLRIVKFLNRSKTRLEAQFSAQLDSSISIPNVEVTSGTPNVPDLTIKAVTIDGTVIRIDTNQQFPLAFYTLKFKNTTSQNFEDINGNAIQEDNSTNVVQFLGLEEPNTVRDTIFDNLSPVYNVEEPGLVRDFLAKEADDLLTGQHDIRETGNANYVDIEVVDEIKRRGFGPTDRLAEEGAYKVSRVGLTPTGSTISGTINFNEARATAILGNNSENVNTKITSFSSDPISLQTVSVIDERVSNTQNENNGFENEVITLANSNVMQIHSIVLIEESGSETIYNINEYGYQIQSNRYDTLNGRRLVTLNSNQIRLSDAALLNGDFQLAGSGDYYKISYSYKNRGRQVSSDSIIVSQTKTATREPVGAFLTVFSLNNYPIVNSSDQIPSLGGVSFLDPSPSSGTPFVATHPAFSSEIVYTESRLPANPGEYAIEYSTGRVFVYGAISNDGTGSSPPVASYSYRKTFVDGIDYDFDADLDEISANSTRSLAGEEVKVQYQYEQVLAEGTDYRALTHIEEIDEEVRNKLVSTTQIRTENYPITNVFRVLNSTTGENYSITRFDQNHIYIDGVNLPRVVQQVNERPEFRRVFNEELDLTEELSSSGGLKVVKLNLDNDKIVSANRIFIGANFNSDIVFSDEDLYLREFYYDNVLQSLSTNLAKLSIAGDYIVDYENGVVYLKTPTSTTEYGQVSYSHGSILTNRPNVMSGDTLAYKPNLDADIVRDIGIASVSYETVIPSSLFAAGERFLNENTDKPILLGSKQNGVAGQRTLNSTTFVALDAVFDSSHADGNHQLIFPDGQRQITGYINSTAVTVDTPFVDNDKSVSWCLVDFDLSDGYMASTTYDILDVRGVYHVTDLQNSDKDSLTNLYNPELDTFSGNVITFNSTAIHSVPAGDALIVDYIFGYPFLDYTNVFDNLLVSYEYGDNQLDFSIGDAVQAGEDYFVSYNYGALREPLQLNFGALTQVDELVNFPLSLDREIYRGAVGGALQSFPQGPTLSSMKNLVSSITKVDPEITELSFNEWTLGRDHLYLATGELTGTEEYEDAKFGKGLIIRDDTTLRFPAEAYISHRNGTFHTWIIPDWRGIDNDATLTFDIGTDGYSASENDGLGFSDGYRAAFEDIYIGASAFNPTTMPFSLNRTDADPYSPIGRPSNYAENEGYFIWYDEDENKWKIRFIGNPNNARNFRGEITTSGQFYNVQDGYNTTTNLYINELNDTLTSTFSYIQFNSTVGGLEGSDGYDGYVGTDGYQGVDGYLSQDGIDFNSDDFHYIFDTGPSTTHNRMSIFKDGQGYLNFRVYDYRGDERPGTSRMYNISHNIQSWAAGEQHHIGSSWAINSAQGIDEMHLFVDGQEVSNVFKYGGRPVATHASDVYRTVANEEVTASATKTVVGRNDGVSTAGSDEFTSATAGFLTNGIVAGDTFTILDETTDGLAGPYTISSVDSDVQVTLSAALTLSLTDINFSVNQITYTTSTDIINENIAVYSVDGYGSTELDCLEAELPDYGVERSGTDTILEIYDGVTVGDQVLINTLGLTHSRVRDYVFKYNTDHTLKTNLPAPANYSDVDIYKVLFRRTSVEPDGYSISGDGQFDYNGTTISATFTSDGYQPDICGPSNTVAGKKYKVILHGTNLIDFSGTNQVVLTGSATETISFTANGSQITSNYFTSMTSVEVTLTPISGYDGYSSIGAVEIIENTPLTQSENGGDYAVVGRYDNGRFTLYTFGSGGAHFDLTPCFYLFDYPTALNIKLTKKGDLFIGSDLDGNNQLDGIIDQTIFLNEMLTDIRAGEIPSADTRTITKDYNSLVPLSHSAQTLMLLNYNENLDNIDTFYTTYEGDIATTGNSVNSNFGDAGVFIDEHLILDNGETIFNNNEGTVEFWVSPAIDTLHDEGNTRYYMDLATSRTETLTPTTKTIVSLSNKARKIESVRLLSEGVTGTDYFGDGKLSVDGKTIILGRELPSQSVQVVVTYIPINFLGERVSIYKDDGYGSLIFEVQNEEETFQIAYPIAWKRNTWHRVMVTWDLNNLDNNDRIRMFIDGVEGGTILYGTPGLLYGIGVLYGSAAAIGSTFLTTDINLTDTFSDIYIGNNRELNAPAFARMDNIRFSNTARTPASVGGASVDLNYNANTSAAFPVIEDDQTTYIADFNKVETETEFLANALSKFTPLFTFKMNVLDSFNIINDDDTVESLISNLVNRLKPAHTSAIIEFAD